jgi:hypothetical protein
MQEMLWAVLLLIAIAIFTASTAFPWDQVMVTGYDLMIASAAVGIPCELVYFALLGIALGRSGLRPRGWYWRSFAHHHLLSPRARLLVLPWFYLGALSFLGIGLGILIVLLAFVTALRQS